MLPLTAPASVQRRIPLNQWVPAHLGPLVCLGTREGAPPLTRYVAIIIAAARVVAPIVPLRAVPDQTISRRVLSGADPGRWHLVPHLAKKHGISNCWLQDVLPFSEQSSVSCALSERSFFCSALQ